MKVNNKNPQVLEVKMKIDDEDQWLLDGKCSICRRVNYCEEDCATYKKQKKALIKQAYKDILKRKRVSRIGSNYTNA